MRLFIVFISILFFVSYATCTCHNRDKGLCTDDDKYFQCRIKERLSDYDILKDCHHGILTTSAKFFYTYHSVELKKFCCKSYKSDANSKPTTIIMAGPPTMNNLEVSLSSEKVSSSSNNLNLSIETGKYCSMLNAHIDMAENRIKDFGEVMKNVGASMEKYHWDNLLKFGYWTIKGIPLGTLLVDGKVFDILFKAMYPDVDADKTDVRNLSNDLIFVLTQTTKRFQNCGECFENIIQTAVGDLTKQVDQDNTNHIKKTVPELAKFFIDLIGNGAKEVGKNLEKRTGIVKYNDLRADVKEALDLFRLYLGDFVNVFHTSGLAKAFEEKLKNPELLPKVLSATNKAYGAIGCGTLRFTLEKSDEMTNNNIARILLVDHSKAANIRTRQQTNNEKEELTPEEGCSEDSPPSFIQALKTYYSTVTCRSFMTMVGCQYDGSFIDLPDLFDACRGTWTRLCIGSQQPASLLESADMHNIYVSNKCFDSGFFTTNRYSNFGSGLYTDGATALHALSPLVILLYFTYVAIL